MLSHKLIPTPLIAPEEKDRIVIDRCPRQMRFRSLYVLRRFFGLGFSLLWMKLMGRSNTKVIGYLLRDFFQQLGILWIKVGQLLSMRVDLLPQDVCVELSRLQYQAHGFDSNISMMLIESELRAPINELFSEFEEIPFAAASISQVHLARLKVDQTLVAVKVRKPGALETFNADMQIIRTIVRWLRRFSIKPHMCWRDLQWEIEQLMIEELDYRYEANNMKRMRKTLRPHKIYVPKVFPRYSTQQVLVMEFVEGVLISDYIKIQHTDPARLNVWLKTNNVKPMTAGRRLFSSMMRQLFEDNLFHGDLHPGNILLLRDSRIAFIDFGSIGFLDREFLEKYSIYLKAVTQQQYAKVFDIYLQFPDFVPSTNLTTLQTEFIETLQSWSECCQVEDLPYTDKSIIALNDRFLQVLGRHKIAMTWVFLRFSRAVTTADAAFRELIPKLDITRLTKRYLRQRVRRGFKQLIHKQDFNVASINPKHILQLPVKLSESMVFQNTIIRRNASVRCQLSAVDQWFAEILTIVITFLRVSGLWLFLLFLKQYHVAKFQWLDAVSWPLPLDTQVWAIIFVSLFYTDHTMVKLRRRFKEIVPKGGGW